MVFRHEGAYDRMQYGTRGISTSLGIHQWARNLGWQPLGVCFIVQRPPVQHRRLSERTRCMTAEEIRQNHFARLNNYRHSAEYAEYAKMIGAPVPEGDLPCLLGHRWEID